jgi:hypothetical protein
MSFQLLLDGQEFIQLRIRSNHRGRKSFIVNSVETKKISGKDIVVIHLTPAAGYYWFLIIR